MKKHILVAPLNWGLGHATRCIPLIHALLEHGFTPVIASDGMALELLKKEFPSLKCVTLPSYNIAYTTNKHVLKLKMFQQAPKILWTIYKERKRMNELIETFAIQGIISDNRWGVYHKHIPSVFITHQLKVLSGKTTWLSTKLHERLIRNFNVCWVPDFENTPYLSGKIGHTHLRNTSYIYIGALSRFRKKEAVIKNDIMVLLSGPEPQRSLLEKKLLHELKEFSGTVLFVRGLVEAKQSFEKIGRVKIYNYMTSNALENALNESQLIISRSGYTTIMDLAKLEKQAFFIPTPGQYEQEYLAARLDTLGIVPSCKQEEFTLEKLKRTPEYIGLRDCETVVKYKNLFGFFETK